MVLHFIRAPALFSYDVFGHLGIHSSGCPGRWRGEDGSSAQASCPTGSPSLAGQSLFHVCFLLPSAVSIL